MTWTLLVGQFPNVVYCPKCQQVLGKSGAVGKPATPHGQGVWNKKRDKTQGKKLSEFAREERSGGVIDVEVNVRVTAVYKHQ